MYVSFSNLSKGLLLTVVQIFHCFLTGRFHGRAGQAYIEDGEYIFSDSKGKEIITKSNWAAKIQIGMTFEMSIVVQKSRSLAVKQNNVLSVTTHVLNRNLVFGWNGK